MYHLVCCSDEIAEDAIGIAFPTTSDTAPAISCSQGPLNTKSFHLEALIEIVQYPELF